MQETRQNKIARMLQKELSLIFQSQTRMMHGVMVSVTRCRVSPDLSICTAYPHLPIGERRRNDKQHHRQRKDYTLRTWHSHSQSGENNSRTEILYRRFARLHRSY